MTTTSTPLTVKTNWEATNTTMLNSGIAFVTLSSEGERIAYKWDETLKSYVRVEEEESKFKSNKEYREWLINQNSQTDGMKEKPSGV